MEGHFQLSGTNKKISFAVKIDESSFLRSFVSFSISSTEIEFLFFLPESLELPKLFGYI